MRRRVAFSRETLQAHALPLAEIEQMELNYRPALPSPAVIATAALIAAGAVLASVTALFWGLQIVGPVAGYVFNLTTLLCVTFVVLWHLSGRQGGIVWDWWTIVRRVVFVVVLLIVIGVGILAASNAAYSLVYAPALVSTAAFSYLAAKQFAYWASVNPAVDWREMRAWQGLWRKLTTSAWPPQCPEMFTARLAAVALLIQAWLGYQATHWFAEVQDDPQLRSAAGLIGLAAVLLPLPVYWLVWHLLGLVPRLSFLSSWQATLKSIQVWLGYGRQPTPAPGVFLLPDKWLRSAGMRQLIVMVALASIAVTILLLTGETEAAPVGVVARRQPDS